MYRNIVLTLLLIVAIVIAIEMRPRAVATQGEPALSTATEQALDRKIPSLMLRHATLRQAIDEMHKATGFEFAVDWLSIPKWDAKFLDIELHDIALADALNYIFQMNRQYYGELEQVDFEIEKRVVRIAESGRFPPNTMAARIYDVRDLLTDQYWGCASGPDPMATQSDRLNSLAGLVERIANTNWDMERSRGGSHGSGEPFGYGDISFGAGRLLIRQTAWGHRQVQATLERLRNGGITPASTARINKG